MDQRMQRIYELHNQLNRFIHNPMGIYTALSKYKEQFIIGEGMKTEFNISNEDFFEKVYQKLSEEQITILEKRLIILSDTIEAAKQGKLKFKIVNQEKRPYYKGDFYKVHFIALLGEKENRDLPLYMPTGNSIQAYYQRYHHTKFEFCTFVEGSSDNAIIDDILKIDVRFSTRGDKKIEYLWLNSRTFKPYTCVEGDSVVMHCNDVGEAQEGIQRLREWFIKNCLCPERSYSKYMPIAKVLDELVSEARESVKNELDSEVQEVKTKEDQWKEEKRKKGIVELVGSAI